MPSDTLQTIEQLTHADTVDAAASGTGEVFIALRKEPADWFDTCLKRLQEMVRLEANWDSYGAAPLDDIAIQYAYAFLRRISMIQGIEPPVVTATPNGQVGLSWEDEQRTMDVEIDGSGCFAYFYERGASEIEKSTSNGNEIIDLLTRV